MDGSPPVTAEIQRLILRVATLEPRTGFMNQWDFSGSPKRW